MLTPLNLNDAMEISKGLREGKNIVEHIAKLERSHVDAQTLATSNLDVELMRYMRNEEKGEAVRALLRIYMATYTHWKEETEQKKIQDAKENLKEEENDDAEKRTNQAVEDSKEPIAEVQGKTLKCTKNIQKKKTATKRKIGRRDRAEPKEKLVKIEKKASDDKKTVLENASDTGIERAMKKIIEANFTGDDDDETDEDAPETEETEEKEDVPEFTEEEIRQKEERAQELARKLRELPSQPRVSDVQRMLREVGPITASLLEDAERVIGSELRSVDEVWWHLCLVQFGVAKYPSSFDVRVIYAKEVKHHAKQQRRLACKLMLMWEMRGY